VGAACKIEDKPPGVILLVEDDPNDAKSIRRAFERGGILNPIQVVSNGEAAIAYLLGEGPYIDRSAYPLPIFVLLDLVLPVTSGFDVLRWIKAHPAHRSLPVIALSGLTDLARINQVYHMGALTFMLKPLRAEELTIRLPRLKGFAFVANGGGGRYIQIGP
jgi:DNA-binding response OmpR family regulator